MSRLRPIAMQRCRGLTLLELLLALASTGMIALAISTMLVSVSYGTSSRQDMRALVVKSKTLCGRVDATLREACMVLEAGDDYLVLWMQDSNDDGEPNVSEIRLLQRDGDGVFRSYQADFSEALSDDELAALDVAYAFDADFHAATQSLQSTDYFPGETWGTDVTQWQVSLNHDDQQSATLLSYRLTLATSEGTLSNPVIGAARLRNHD